tara:strand:- start:249 stop:542 length:294 start_codon:yes stop_codon:yes gene_type:complete
MKSQPHFFSIRAGDLNQVDNDVPTQTFRKRYVWRDKKGKLHQRIRKWEEPIEEEHGNIPESSERRVDSVEGESSVSSGRHDIQHPDRQIRKRRKERS